MNNTLNDDTKRVLISILFLKNFFLLAQREFLAIPVKSVRVYFPVSPKRGTASEQPFTPIGFIQYWKIIDRGWHFMKMSPDKSNASTAVCFARDLTLHYSKNFIFCIEDSFVNRRINLLKMENVK